jgi:hypothetical protein
LPNSDGEFGSNDDATPVRANQEGQQMTGSRKQVFELNANVVRVTRDFLLTLMMLVAVAASIGVEPSSAVPAIKFQTVLADSIGLVSLPVQQDFVGSSGLRGVNPVNLALLALGISLLTAFNLAILRYLRRVYASPRRGGGRRG